jgi:hypothetical protein
MQGYQGVKLMKTQVMNKIIVLMIGLLAGWSSLVQAGMFVIQPIAATADTNNGTGFYMSTQAINGTGFDSAYAAEIETGDPVPGYWPIPNSDQQETMWMSTGATSGWIAFDLGTKYAVSALHVWNYNLGAWPVYFNRGVKDVMVQYKNALDVWVNAESMQFTKATSGDYRGDNYALTSPINAQYIRFSISTNWGYENTVGIQEVRFVGDNIPEPATMGLLLSGGLVFILRRRR